MQDVAAALIRLLVSALLAAPFAADWVARLLGWRIFYLADGTFQFLWATGLVIWGAGGFHGRAFRSLLQRRIDGGAAVSVAALSLYGYGAWVTFAGERVPGREGLPFGTLAAMLVLLNLGRLLEAALGVRLLGEEWAGPSEAGGTVPLLRRTWSAAGIGALLAVVLSGLAAAWRLRTGGDAEGAVLTAVAVLLAVRPDALGMAVWAPVGAAMRSGPRAGVHFLTEVALFRAGEIAALVVHPRFLVRSGAMPDGEVQAAEAVRRVAVRTVAELKAAGVSVCVTTSGADPAVEAVGQQVGVDRLLLVDGGARLSEHLSALRTGGRAVALFTGSREEPEAVQAADLIFAVAPVPAGEGTERTITLRSGDLRAVLWAMRLSRRALRRARAMLALLAVYNAAAAVAAILGWLPPVAAAGAAALAGVVSMGGAVRLSGGLR